MQKTDIHILSTRKMDEAIIANTAGKNIYIDALSFIDVQPVDSEELKKRLQPFATQSLYAVFTSRNAVTAVARHVGKTAPWKISCTGGKTKESISQHFGEAAIVASAKSAALLAEEIIAHHRTEKVTFFCGDQRLNDLPERLGNSGIQTEEVMVYTSVLTPVFTEKNYDGILFLSPSAAHSFFSINTVPPHTVLFSIGHTTTAAIQLYCANRIITSEWPDTENLLQLVTHFYTTTSQKVD